MIGAFFGNVWRGIRLAFTLKGLLVISVLGVLVVGMVFALPRKILEPTYVPSIETTGTPGMEASQTPRMAIVFVGLGNEGRGLETLLARLLALNTPFTYAVAPGSANSKRHAQLVGTPPSEVDLFLPTAFSKGRADGGNGWVAPTMRRRQIGRQVVKDIYSIGTVSGIVTRGGYARGKTDADMMRIVLAMAKRRNLYVLDTTSNSAAKSLAAQGSVEYLQPDVTLDTVPRADAIKKQMSIAINKAVATKGNVIVLARLQPVTVNLMAELTAKVKEAKIELTSVSQLNASESTATPSVPSTSTLDGSGSILPAMPTTSTMVPTGTAPRGFQGE